MKNSGQFFLGAAIGFVAGALVSYFLDKENRTAFAKQVNDTADKAKESVIEGYYEAKERYEKYRDALKKSAEKIGNNVEDFIEDTSEKTRKAINATGEKAQKAFNSVSEKVKEARGEEKNK